MKRPIAAALLSGLVFPGLGHLYLKRYSRGAALIAVSAISLFVIFFKAADQIMAVMGKAEAEGGILDPSQVLEWLSQAASTPGPPALALASWVFIACWAFGLVDAYRLGRR